MTSGVGLTKCARFSQGRAHLRRCHRRRNPGDSARERQAGAVSSSTTPNRDAVILIAGGLPSGRRGKRAEHQSSPGARRRARFALLAGDRRKGPRARARGLGPAPYKPAASANRRFRGRLGLAVARFAHPGSRRAQTLSSLITKPVRKSSYSPVGRPFFSKTRTTL